MKTWVISYDNSEGETNILGVYTESVIAGEDYTGLLERLGDDVHSKEFEANQLDEGFRE